MSFTRTRHLVDANGTITSGGVAQTLLAANSSRTYLLIVNPASIGGDNLYIETNGTAVSGSGIVLYPGGSVTMDSYTCASNAISIIGPTTSQKFTCKYAND